ncbi:MAG: hypothetical protein IMZ61_11500, partial [Planctomycetes bacterium]|nr:hypothetical protein [Planctomycetota bacterium]
MNKKKKPREMPLYWYRVNVCRISYGNQYIKIAAHNKREAQRAAEDEAGNLSFTEHTSEYQAQT